MGCSRSSRPKRPAFCRSGASRALAFRRRPVVRASLRAACGGSGQGQAHGIRGCRFFAGSINHMQGRADGGVVARASRYAACQGVRAVLKCSGAFPPDGRVDWPAPPLARKGRAAEVAPASLQHAPILRCIWRHRSPQRHRTAVGKADRRDGRTVLDRHRNGVRTDGLLDIDKCAAVCAAVYG